MLTHKELLSIIKYCPDSGTLNWIGKRSGTNRSSAGHKRKDGYITVRINYRPYLAQRIAWFYMTGHMPSGHIDHIDRNPSNNAWNNLREVTRSQNEMNRGAAKCNKIGIKGVYKTKYGTYRACVVANKKQHAKSFKSLEEAVYWAKQKRLELHGEHARHE